MIMLNSHVLANKGNPFRRRTAIQPLAGIISITKRLQRKKKEEKKRKENSWYPGTENRALTRALELIPKIEDGQGEHCLNERESSHSQLPAHSQPPPTSFIFPSRPSFSASPSLLLSTCDLYNIRLFFLIVVSSIYFPCICSFVYCVLSRGSRHERERVSGQSQRRD